ncbi:MAG: PucR family transcriptional regulator ligand-binding domain-containing protein [Lachnospiraceae bacterium]|nr:PucR family transcriptional regulator ligand-binding domain-containing protein [Lachnospiraceae bacterium]
MMEETVRIEWFMNHAGFEHIVCLAGEECIGNEIKGIHIMDNPDTLRFFKEGEMVLTTGFSLKNLSEEQRREIVRELAKKKCSGIALKINRYFKTVPKEIIEEARLCLLPVLEVPYEYSLSDIEHRILYQIFCLQNDHFSYTHDLYSKITQLVLGGEGILELCEMLQQYLNYAVAFLDEAGMVLATSSNKHHIGQGSKLFNIGEMKELRNAFRSGKFMVKQKKVFGTRTIACKLWEMISNDTIVGYFCLSDVDDEDLQMNVLKAIEYILPLLQIELMRYKTTNTTSIRAKAELLGQLLSRRNEDGDLAQLLYCCDMFGFRTDMAYLCIVWENQNEKIDTGIRSIMKNRFGRDESQFLLGVVGDNIICIYGEQQDIEKGCHIKRAEAVVQQIAKMYGAYDSQKFGIGGSVTGIDHIWKSYEKALLSLKVNKTMHTPLEERRKQMMAEIIYAFLDDTELEGLYQMTFGKLKAYDREKNGNLVETLGVFIRNDFNVKVTAEQLYIHRNTLSQRLAKIYECIGELHGENRARVYMGYIAMQILYADQCANDHSK